MRFLENLLDDLLFFDQECSYDTVADTVAASGSTVGTLDGLLWAGDLRVFAGSEGWDAWELDATVTAFWGSSLLLDVQVTELSTRSLDDTSLVRLGVVWHSTPVLKSGARHFE